MVPAPEIEDLLHRIALRAAHRQPLVTDQDRDCAACLLALLILRPLDRAKFFADHCDILATPPGFVPPWEIRMANGRPIKLLPPRVLEAASSGPGTWTTDEILMLLTDECTQSRFALLIHELMPDWWLDSLAHAGKPADDAGYDPGTGVEVLP